MTVGTVREIKNEEFRVGLTPEGAHALVDAGHRVLVETGAGEGIGCGDDAYRAAGATIADARDGLGASDLLVKVKEPLEEESAGCATTRRCSRTCTWPRCRN